MLRFLCPSCGALLVAESQRLTREDPEQQLDTLAGLARLVKEGRKFKETALSPGLEWDVAYASPSPARRYTPSVRKVRQRYVQDGDFIQFCLDLDEAIRVHGIRVDDLIW